MRYVQGASSAGVSLGNIVNALFGLEPQLSNEGFLSAIVSSFTQNEQIISPVENIDLLISMLASARAVSSAQMKAFYNGRGSIKIVVVNENGKVIRVQGLLNNADQASKTSTVGGLGMKLGNLCVQVGRGIRGVWDSLFGNENEGDSSNSSDSSSSQEDYEDYSDWADGYW